LDQKGKLLHKKSLLTLKLQELKKNT